MISTDMTTGTVVSTTQRQHDAMVGGAWVSLILVLVMIFISTQPALRARWKWWGGRFGVPYPMTAVGRMSWILSMAIFGLRFFLEGFLGIRPDLNTRHITLVIWIALPIAGSIHDHRYWKKHGEK
jgi:hypothetical protein